jgi:hypothetical protein
LVLDDQDLERITEISEATVTMDDLRRLPPDMIHAPEGSSGPAMVPGPPMPVSGALEWLDTNGKAIGPERKSIGQPRGFTAP